MAATMSTIARVRRRATGNSSSPPDAAITDYIEDAEAIINVISRHNWISGTPTYNSTKHTLLTQIATDLAAAWAVAADPAVATTNSEAALMIDTLWASAERGLQLLADKRVVEYLKGL